MKHKLSAALVCGFGAAVLETVPGIKSIGCCLLLPGAVVLSLYFYLRLTSYEERITTNTAVVMGLITGIVAALFSVSFEALSTFLFKTNDFVASLPQVTIVLNSFNLGDVGKETIAILQTMSKEIMTTGFSVTYLFFLLFNNLIINVVFGIVGGFVGLSLLNKKYFSNL